MLCFLLYTALSILDPYEKPSCLSNINCPDSIDSILTSISEKQFCGCKLQNSKTQIGPSVKRIPPYAFYGATIKEMKLNSEIESIGEGAFGNCTIKLNISELVNLKTIEDGAFYRANVSPIIIFPQNIDTIGSYAFANMTTLEKSLIRCKTIKSNAFLGCHNMKCEKIEIYGSGSIQEHSFHDCYQLNGILIVHEANEKDSTNNQLILSTIEISAFQNSGIKKLLLPPLKKIGSHCFYNCSQLTECSILNSKIIDESSFEGSINIQIETIKAKYIGYKAFQNCHKLNSKIILYKGGSIEKDSFHNCEKIVFNNFVHNKKISKMENVTGKCGTNLDFTITFDDDYYYEYIATLHINGYGQMYNFSKNNAPWNYYRDSISKIIIDREVTSIGSYAFYDFTELSHIYFDQNMKSIGDYAFSHCTSLRSVTFKEGIEKIGESAFENCSYIYNDVELPDSLTYLGNSSFLNCNRFNYLHIGSKLRSFNYHMFDNNENVRFKVSENNPFYTALDGDLYMKNPLTLIKYCGYHSVDDQVGVNPILLNGVTKIGDNVFQNSLVSKVNLPDTITHIGSYSFSNCVNLDSISLGINIQYIGDYAFENCKNLEYIEFPETVEYIGEFVIKYCPISLVFLLSSKAKIEPYSFNSIGSFNTLLIYTGESNPYENTSIIVNNFKVCVPFQYEGDYFGSLYVYKCLICGNCGKNVIWTFNSLKRDMYLNGYGNMTDYSLSKVPWDNFNPYIYRIITNNEITSIGGYSFKNCVNLQNVQLGTKIKSIGHDAFHANSKYKISFRSYEDIYEIYYLIVYYRGKNDPDCSSFSFYSSNTVYKDPIAAIVSNNYSDYMFCSNRVFEKEQIEEMKITLLSSPKYSTGIVFISDKEKDGETLDEKLKEEFKICSTVLIYSKHSVFDSSLNNNQFVKLLTGSFIDFVGGNLNLLLDSSSYYSFVIMHDVNNLLIRGYGYLNIRNYENNMKTIHFRNETLITGRLIIIVPDHFKSVKFDLIQFDSKPSLDISTNNSIEILCDKIIVSTNSKVDINNITINDSLTIYQTAKVKLNNVMFNNDAVIEYLMFNFDKSKDTNVINPFIGISSTNIPKSIILSNYQKNTFSFIEENSNYIFMSDFKNNDDCSNWLSVINISKSGFTSKMCVNNSIVLHKEISNDKVTDKKKKPPLVGHNEKIGLILLACGVTVITVSIVVHYFHCRKSKVENE